MSAMDNMLATMLSKMMPPEIMAALSPENIALYSEQAKAVLEHFKSELDLIKNEQMRQHDLLTAILERLDNVGSKSSNRGRKSIGSDSGSGSGSNGD